MSETQSQLSYPNRLTYENIHDVEDDAWDRWTLNARVHFNYIFELAKRNENSMFATHLFKIEGTDNKIALHKIMNAGAWNMAFQLAEFITEQETDDEDYDEDLFSEEDD